MATFDLIPSDAQTSAYLRLPPETTSQMSGSEVRTSLESQRMQALSNMVEEPDRARRKVLMQMVLALEAAIASLPSDQSQSEYGRFKRVRDAIKEYLRTVGRAVPAEQIGDALIEGGLRRKPEGRKSVTDEEVIENTRSIIRKSIGFHLINPRGIGAHLIREANGKVGLWEWPDERFK